MSHQSSIKYHWIWCWSSCFSFGYNLCSRCPLFQLIMQRACIRCWIASLQKKNCQVISNSWGWSIFCTTVALAVVCRYSSRTILCVICLSFNLFFIAPKCKKHWTTCFSVALPAGMCNSVFLWTVLFCISGMNWKAEGSTKIIYRCWAGSHCIKMRVQSPS